MKSLFYIIAGVFDFAVIWIFMEGVMQRRKGWWIWALIAGVSGGNFLVSGIFTERGMSQFNLVISILFLFFLSLLYEGTIMQRVLYVVILQFLAMISEIVTAYILFSYAGIQNRFAEAESFALVISKLLFLIFVMVSLALMGKRKHIPRSCTVGFISIPLLSMVILYGLSYEGRASAEKYVAMSAVLLLNFLSYHILSLMADAFQNRALQEALREQMRSQEEKYDQLSTALTRGNRILHDVKKHLLHIQLYLENNEVSEADAYIRQVTGEIERVYPTIKTGHQTIDFILNNMAEQLKKCGVEIQWQLSVKKEHMKIADYDLMIILGNIADNVLDAAENLDGGNVNVYVKTKMQGLYISVSNSVSDSEKKVDRYKRKELSAHGYGLQNIRDTVRKYNGVADFYREGNCFFSEIMIPDMEAVNNETKCVDNG